MHRRALSALAAVLLPAVASAATPAQLCEAAKLKAASSFFQCRGKADAAFAGSAKGPTETAKRDALYAKCNDSLVRGYGAAEVRYGASCPTTGDVGAVRTYLTQCSLDVGAALEPGSVGVPDYIADLAACNVLLTTALAGTATAADVAKGKTFTSATGIGTPGTAYPNALLATGQTTSYGAGSDGAVQAGTAKSFTDNGNGTVTDNRTGLMWEKKSDDGGIHDKDTTYTWGQNASPYAMNGTMVTTFLATLNTAPCFAGHCDWRAPNITELLTLLNYEESSPATFAAFDTGCTAGCTATACSCTVSFGYWSSSTNRNSPGLAWGVNFGNGYADYAGKTLGLCVRAVRGGS